MDFARQSGREVPHHFEKVKVELFLYRKATPVVALTKAFKASLGARCPTLRVNVERVENIERSPSGKF